MVFEEFHKIAIAYLYTKQKSGRLAGFLLHLSLEDFAVDCIAELFERDKENKFTRLVDYYSQFSIAAMDETALYGITRRLVFSEVSNRIFKAYGESDPNLRKLIRNLKDTKSSSRASVKLVNDKWWVCFGDANPSAFTLPLIPPELLEVYLVPLVSANRNLRVLLNDLTKQLADQACYSRAFPLVGFAQILLSAFESLGEMSSIASEDDRSFEQQELRTFLEECIATVKFDKKQSYVGKNKIEETMYCIYFDVISESLEAEFIHNDGDGTSLFARLADKCDNLSRETYHAVHRVFLEYLLKETRAALLKKVKDEL
ncbi:MAG: hypothetical protein KF749_02935 [Bacteroidetes bacterium]|nr:hypothetical protein [Bacteroidota bacterium]MCW5896771.1 hypothetical protein [Bacteroidota bacterium]